MANELRTAFDEFLSAARRGDEYGVNRWEFEVSKFVCPLLSPTACTIDNALRVVYCKIVLIVFVQARYIV
jgi:hypothetical protein